MRFLHVSDLHIGKSMNGMSLIHSGDQRAWVDHFLELTDEIRPDAVVIAGDIYDRGNPAGEAMGLFDHMLTGINEMGVPVLMIAGNHDAGERIGFAGSMLARNQVYIAGIADKEMTHVTLQGSDGDQVTFWLMPYVFPALVAHKLDCEPFKDYDSAVRALLAAQDIDFSQKNVLVAHQNVTAFGKECERGGSESMVGGVGQIDFSAFDGFDYVALGHIHAAYHVGRPEIRYAGSPLCYHFDETKKAKKGPLLVTIGEKASGKADVTVELKEIEPLHPLRVIEGAYEEIREAEEKNTSRNEYVSITLTDCRVSPEKSDYLRKLFESRDGRVLELMSSYQEQKAGSRTGLSLGDVASSSMKDLFEDFYAFRNKDKRISEEESEVLKFAQQLATENAGRIDKDGKTSSIDAEIDRLVEHIRKLAEVDG